MVSELSSYLHRYFQKSIIDKHLDFVWINYLRLYLQSFLLDSCQLRCLDLKFTFFNTWYLVSGTVWKGFGDVILLEEVCQ